MQCHFILIVVHQNNSIHPICAHLVNVDSLIINPAIIIEMACPCNSGWLASKTFCLIDLQKQLPLLYQQIEVLEYFSLTKSTSFAH
ncbi:CLUMA_CG003511, isoform A [Clunio marinus]|uniref:CLUMA_CG003511, isoform A n=1 Tax=Clunio marinus TaxID=568069 RepID=A0A1J1HTP1_9DIPT|nr:CLUMA_CG003511, isoform A [Clunio marinus]